MAYAILHWLRCMRAQSSASDKSRYDVSRPLMTRLRIRISAAIAGSSIDTRKANNRVQVRVCTDDALKTTDVHLASMNADSTSCTRIHVGTKEDPYPNSSHSGESGTRAQHVIISRKFVNVFKVYSYHLR